ncbi:MAG: hypothetical protein GY832_22050 [Chloroflexi bacterium]|nr:hypothetical protein [Chloroflexota bacterium]
MRKLLTLALCAGLVGGTGIMRHCEGRTAEAAVDDSGVMTTSSDEGFLIYDVGAPKTDMTLDSVVTNNTVLFDIAESWRPWPEPLTDDEPFLQYMELGETVCEFSKAELRALMTLAKAEVATIAAPGLVVAQPAPAPAWADRDAMEAVFGRLGDTSYERGKVVLRAILSECTQKQVDAIEATVQAAIEPTEKEKKAKAANVLKELRGVYADDDPIMVDLRKKRDKLNIQPVE